MGGNKPQATQAWRTATTDNRPIVAPTDGDGLNSLRVLRDKYLDKASYLNLLGHDSSFYLRAASAVTRLLGEPERTLTVEFTVAAA